MCFRTTAKRVFRYMTSALHKGSDKHDEWVREKSEMFAILKRLYEPLLHFVQNGFIRCKLIFDYKGICLHIVLARDDVLMGCSPVHKGRK